MGRLEREFICIRCGAEKKVHFVYALTKDELGHCAEINAAHFETAQGETCPRCGQRGFEPKPASAYDLALYWQ